MPLLLPGQLPLLSLRMDLARGSLYPTQLRLWQRWPALFSKSVPTSR